MSEEKKDRHYAAPALEKGLEVLELLAREERSLSQAEIARLLGRSANELYRMLSVLERCRYIRRDPDSGLYSLTLKLYSIGQSCNPVGLLKEAAIDPMRDYAYALKAEIHLSIIDDSRLVVIHQQTGPGPVKLSVEPGGIHNPIRTVSGRLLLARMEEKERDHSIERAASVFHFDTQAAKVLNWEEIRNERILWSYDEAHTGLLDAATLVKGEGGIMAALATTVFHSIVSEGQKAEIGKALLQSASEIRRSLGI